MPKRVELARARKIAGHTQESFAEALGVDRSTVIRWEAGEHEPLPYLWPKAARLLAVSSARLSELIGPSVAGPLQADRLAERRRDRTRDPVETRESAFFGVGPVTVATPLRSGRAGRERILVAAEDVASADVVHRLLTDLGMSSRSAQLTGDVDDPPPGDAVVICGPKSAAVGARLIGLDPRLGMVHDRERWWIHDRSTGDRHGSPSDDDSRSVDLAYLARHWLDDRTVLHIAGIHSIGSLGAATYLRDQLPGLCADTGDSSFSAVLRCAFDGLEIIDVELVLGPYLW